MGVSIVNQLDRRFVELLVQLYDPFLLDYDRIKDWKWRFTITQNGKPIGYIAIMSRQKPFVNVAVVPNARYKGIVAPLLKRLLKELKLRKFLWTVHKANYPSLKLLYKMGGGIFAEDRNHFYGYLRANRDVPDKYRIKLEEALGLSYPLFQQWQRTIYSTRKKLQEELEQYINRSSRSRGV